MYQVLYRTGNDWADDGRVEFGVLQSLEVLGTSHEDAKQTAIGAVLSWGPEDYDDHLAVLVEAVVKVS